jgi:endonuclease/exonuclease/phosphatase family metal-dependent hydrolase
MVIKSFAWASTVNLTEAISQINLTDILKTFHPYTFFSAPHGTFSKIDHILGHKTDFSRYKNIEIIPCTLSDHHGVRFVLNMNKNNGKHT